MYTHQKTHLSRTDNLKSLALAFLLGPVASFSALADYTLIDLGVDVSPTDISNAGTIVGSRKSDTGSIAFRRFYDGLLQDIAGTTVANAVNEFDQVTGKTPGGAFLLDGNNLHEWGGYGGYGINEAGQISGNKQLNNPYRATPLPLDPAIYTPSKWDNPGIATVYSRGTRKGVYADLYILNDINDAGFAVGSRSRYGLVGSSSILTTPAFNAVSYLSTPYGGSAKAINNQNMIVGTSGSNSSTGEYAHAYLYDYNADSLQDLGTLNGGLGLTSSAADINESNQVVGTSWLVTQLTSLYDPAQYHAFLWENGHMTDLNDASIQDNAGWILTAASAINDNGDIVGSGLVGGQVHGFLLVTGQAPPPPVGEAPVATVNADPTAGKAPLTVNFSTTPDATIASYAWDFGDGTAAEGAMTSHTYEMAGRFIASLTVTDTQGLTDRAEVSITVRKSRGRK
jgi:probable HAF family extracellular repeat protein